MAEDRAAILAEAYRRGILPPEQKAAYEEAIRRGLVDAKPEMGWGEYADNLVRQTANAATFGYADEIAAGLNSLFNGKTYEENVTAERGRDRQFESQYPVAATAAQVGGGLATGIPGGMRVLGMRAVSRLPRVAQYGLAGAIPGAAAGSGFADGDVGDRLAGAAVGGAVGGALGAAIPQVANAVGAVAERAARPVLDRIGAGPARAVDRKVLQAFERDGKTPGQVGARLRTLGPNATIADAAGENTIGLAETLANQPGPGRQTATRVLQQRQKGAGERINQSAARELGDGRYYETLDELNTLRRTEAAPLYDEAYAANFVWNERVAELVQRPSMGQALTRAYRIAAEEGRDPQALGLAFNEAGDVTFTRTPSMQTLDYVKRGLDDVVEQFRDPVTGKLRLDESGRAINNTRAEFVKQLREMNPTYAEALDAWAGPSQLMDAMAKGRGFAKNDAEITASVVRQMSQGEREAFLLGVRRGIEDIVSTTGRTADATRKLMGTPKMAQALQAAFPDAGAYRRFLADLLRERQFNETRNTVLANSATARRLAGQADAPIDPMPLAEIAQGNFLTGARELVRNLFGAAKTMPEPQARELARLLLSTDPAANADALRRLSGGTQIINLSPLERQRLAVAINGQLAQQSQIKSR